MAQRKQDGQEEPRNHRRPATSLQSRERQMVALAVDLAEQQLRNGTATSQVISHYLKLGSSRELLEQERLENENNLLKAKVETLAAQARIEELYSEAIRAMRSYAGQDEPENPDEYED